MTRGEKLANIILIIACILAAITWGIRCYFLIIGQTQYNIEEMYEEMQMVYGFQAAFFLIEAGHVYAQTKRLCEGDGGK